MRAKFDGLDAFALMPLTTKASMHDPCQAPTFVQFVP